MTSNIEDITNSITNNEITTDEQFQDLFFKLPLPLIKSVVFNIYPYFIRLEDDDVIKQRYHSLRTVIEKRSRSGKTSGLWQILLLFVYAKRNVLFPEDKDLETLLDGALEATQTSWTITYLYAIYELYDRITEEDCKERKQVFDNVPDLATVSPEKIKSLLEKNGLHLKAGVLWNAYVDLLLAHKKYNEAFDAIEYLMQVPIPFSGFVDRVKNRLEGKSDGTKTENGNQHHEGDGGDDEHTEEEKSEEPEQPPTNEVNLMDNERKIQVLKLLENYTTPVLLKSREEFDLKRKELVKSADSKAIQWLQKYFTLWTDYLDVLETSDQLQDTNFQVRSIAMGTDLLCYEYKRLLVESENLQLPQIVIYPIFEKLATRIMSLSQLNQSFANDQKWIIEFTSILKDTAKNNLEFWITLISLQSLCVGPYFNFATTQDIAPKVKNIIVEACAANQEWAKLPPLQFITAEVNAEISQLGITDEAELKARSKEIWEAKIKNYESRVDPNDDEQVESLADLWFEYMETLGEEEDLEPYFEKALTFPPLRTISTIWMDYVSEAIDKDVNLGYEQFQKALGSVKDQYKDLMWQELFEAVKQDTGLSLDELKELVSSLGKEPNVVPPNEKVEAEKPKEVTSEVKPMIVDLTSDDEQVAEKKSMPATNPSVSPKPAIPPPTAAAKKAPSPIGKKQDTSPPPAAFPKKRPAPTPLSPKLGKRRKLGHENSPQMPGFLQSQRYVTNIDPGEATPGSPPLSNVQFRPLSPSQIQSLPFAANSFLNSFARPQVPVAPNNMPVNPMQLQVAPQLQQLMPAIQLQQLAQLMQSKQREQQAIQLQQQLQQLIVQLNLNPALGPILAPQIQLISQRLLSLQQPGVGAPPPVPGAQLPFHKPPIQHDKVKRLDFDTKFQLDVKYIQDLLPHFNIDDFKQKPEEFDLSVQIEPLENVMSMFLRQRAQSQQQQPNTANLPPLPDYTVQQISELVKNSTFREIIKQLQMRQSQLEMDLAQQREQVLQAQAKERNALIHMHNMRLQATPGRTDYVLKKNDNEMRSLEQTFKQQLLEFDQQSLRDFDKKIEEQQIILQQAGVPGFFPTQSQQQLAQQGQILDFIVQKIKETEKLLQNQSRAFEQPQSSFNPSRPQERIVTIQKNASPVVQQTRDPRLPNMEVTAMPGNIPPQQVDPLVLLQNQPDILAGLLQNNPAALLIATQGTPQQKQELLGQLQRDALLIAAQGTPQQQQELMNQLIAQQQQQQQQSIGLPNMGMSMPPPSIGQPPQQNPNFGMGGISPPPMTPIGPMGGPMMPPNNNTNTGGGINNFMSPQQQLMNQLQNITNSSVNPNNPLLLPGINNPPLQQMQPQQQQPQQQQFNNNNNNNQFRGGYNKRGGRPYNNRGRF